MACTELLIQRVRSFCLQTRYGCTPARVSLGITVDEARTRGYAERTSALATALNPIVGYERAAAIVKESLATGRSIVDLVVESGLLSADEARQVLDPLRAAGVDPD